MNTSREIAEKISLEIPGNWPDDKSQETRIAYVEQALIKYREEGRQEALREAAEICHGTCAWTAKKEILSLIPRIPKKDQ